MSHCTNCGTEIKGKICMTCAAKNNTVHKHCYWCGTALNENAAICFGCNERVDAIKPFRMKKGRFVLAFFLAFLAIGAITGGSLFECIALLLCAVLVIPIWGNIVAKATHKMNSPARENLRIVLKVVRIILAVGLFIAAVS